MVTMSSTLTIRLPEGLLQKLREESRITGFPMARLVRISLEKALFDDKDDDPSQHVWKQFAGIIKGGPADLSSRKGFSRK
jgi:hypothetical protein